jgi:hypothetical protein
MVARIVCYLEGHVGHPTAAVHCAADRVAHQIRLNGCQVVRSSTAPEFIQSVHAPLNLLSNELKVLARDPVHTFGDGRRGIHDGFGVAGRAFRRPLRELCGILGDEAIRRRGLPACG